jgi:hypothetical protein
MNIHAIIDFAKNAFPTDSQYWNGLQHAYAEQHPPTPKAIGAFDSCRPGLVGFNRLRRVLAYVDAIEQARFRGNSKLDENQRAMINMYIAAALPHIVTPSEYSMHRQQYVTHTHTCSLKQTDI